MISDIFGAEAQGFQKLYASEKHCTVIFFLRNRQVPFHGTLKADIFLQELDKYIDENSYVEWFIDTWTE